MERGHRIGYMNLDILIKQKEEDNMKALGKWKKPILILSDAVLINLAYILAFYFRYNYRNFKFYWNNHKDIGLIITVI